MRFGWSRPDQSSTYVIEIGNAPGTTSRTIETGNNGDFSIVANLPAGEQFARVRAQSSSGLSEPSNEVRFFVVDFRDFVEAVFLGTGPSRTMLTSGCGDKFPGPQCQDFLLSYPQGTTVRALAWSGLAAPNLDATRATLQQISQATEGALNTTFELTDQSRPSPGTNQITFGLKTADSQCGDLRLAWKCRLFVPESCAQQPRYFLPCSPATRCELLLSLTRLLTAFSGCVTSILIRSAAIRAQSCQRVLAAPSAFRRLSLHWTLRQQDLFTGRASARARLGASYRPPARSSNASCSWNVGIDGRKRFG